MSSHDLAHRDDVIVQHGVVGDVPDPPGVVGDSIKAIRFLAADAVEKADSGHPGTPMGLAPLAYLLWTRHLRYDPSAPDWPDRDRFIMSGGHACLLQYAALHLAGYDLTIDDLKRFRQWDSRTPGHPERERTAGIEINTGPLGQGFANAVGMAVAERMLAARFNQPGAELVDHRIWVELGEGDLMEGITTEAMALAGRLRLGRLIAFYDDNAVTLSTQAAVEMRQSTGEIFSAYGWHVTEVGNVNDLDALDAAIVEARETTDRPSVVIVHSHIGYGSPVQDTPAAHGKALGEENLAKTREALDWPYPPFEIPEEVYAHWRGAAELRASTRQEWEDTWRSYRADHPDAAAEFDRLMRGAHPDAWEDAARPDWAVDDEIATRVAGGRSLNAFAATVPELVGGEADVAPSTHTTIENGGDVNADEWRGRNIHFGVREHTMGAICNGMAAHGGFVPFCSTFFSFSDYMREPIRLAAIMQLPVVFVFTHDSIAVGEDGPTHQPVEQLASLRAMPGLRVVRPADANETFDAWRVALAGPGPTALVLTRQGVPVLDPASLDLDAGGSIVADGGDVTLVATGSEVSLALATRSVLEGSGTSARVVSLPSWEILRERGDPRRDQLIPPDVPSISLELGATQGWRDWVDHAIGVDRFGASAPRDDVLEHYGFTPDQVAARVMELLGGV
ncbi:MAG: transketolase [Acidimicrobiia bacterium]|nr:transketolase [Acidimicrobiia bacterium]